MEKTWRYIISWQSFKYLRSHRHMLYMTGHRGTSLSYYRNQSLSRIA